MVADSIGSEAKRLPSPPLCRLSPKPIYFRLKPRWWIVVADTTRVKKQDKGVRNYISSGGAGKRGQSRKKQRWRTVVTGSGGSQWRRRGYHSFLLLHTPVVGTKHLRLDQEKQQQQKSDGAQTAVADSGSGWWKAPRTPPGRGTEGKNVKTAVADTVGGSWWPIVMGIALADSVGG